MSNTGILTKHGTQELVTGEVQDVLSWRPHWIVRKGNYILLFVAIALLTLSFVISYPDMIRSRGKLIALNAPKLIVARTEGKLMKLFVSNGQVVARGKHLGYLEATGKYEDVLVLMDWVSYAVDKAGAGDLDWFEERPLPVLINLGELQTVYQHFQNQLELTKQTLHNGYYQQKKKSLNRDLAYLSILDRSKKEVMKLQETDRELRMKEYSAYELLAKEKVIAPLELDHFKSKLLERDQSLKQMSDQIVANEINSEGKIKDVFDVEKQVTDQRQLFRAYLLELKSELEKWIQLYVLVASEDGKVSFVSSLQENQLINNGESLFFIEPEHSSYYVEVKAGQKGFGKIKINQKVIFRVDGYPSHEFGNLVAHISYIPGVPAVADSFLLRADLADGLQTTYGKHLFFSSGLVGEVDVITEKRRLFDRFFGKLKDLAN